MARIKFSALISEIRGKIGGAVFQGNQSGIILRSHSVNVNKKTVSQSNIRNINNRLHVLWNSLTDTQKNKFNLSANFSNTKQKNNNSLSLNGKQFFMKSNFYFLLYNKTPITTPVFRKFFLSPITCYLTFNENILSINVNRVLNANYEFLIFAASNVKNNSIKKINNQYRYILVNTTTSSQFDITSLYTELFGILPASNNQIFYKYSILDVASGVILPFSYGVSTF